MAHVMLRLYVEHVLTAKLVKRSDFISLGVVVLVVHFCLLVIGKRPDFISYSNKVNKYSLNPQNTCRKFIKMASLQQRGAHRIKALLTMAFEYMNTT
jgi:hypothetical protein